MTKETKKDESKPADDAPAPAPQRREKPQLPSVAYLLQYGADKDPNAPPETFLESLIMPGLLLLTFVVSLVLFHWATNGFTGGDNQSHVNFQQKFGNKASEL